MVKKITILFIITIPIIVFIFLFVIYKDVRTNCIKATRQYGEDCIGSLTKIIQSDKTSFREKNSAVWTLSQLADKKALPFLYELDKATPEQDRCSYDKYLCKYEIKKAIKWCEKGNVTSWIYKGINKEEVIGGQRDEHGCLGPAGYSWCETKNKCLRIWEEPCE